MAGGEPRADTAASMPPRAPLVSAESSPQAEVSRLESPLGRGTRGGRLRKVAAVSGGATFGHAAATASASAARAAARPSALQSVFAARLACLLNISAARICRGAVRGVQRCLRRCGGPGARRGTRGAIADLGAATAARAGMHVLKSEGNQRIAGSRAHEQRPAQNRPTAGTGGLGVAGAARWRALLFAGAPARHEQLRRRAESTARGSAPWWRIQIQGAADVVRLHFTFRYMCTLMVVCLGQTIYSVHPSFSAR